MTSLFDLDENSSDSEDDVDYVPEGNVSDVSVSDGDASNDDELPEEAKSNKKSRKKRKQSFVESEETPDKNNVPEVTKAKADDIWKSFLEEVEQPPPNKNEIVSKIPSPTVSSTENNTVAKIPNSPRTDSPKEKLSDILEFAGETISVSKEGCITNVPGKTDSDSDTNSTNNKSDNAPAVKRKGLQSVLGTIMNKKQKINTLQKSLIDWKSYKKDEGIEEELQTFNRGKGGFIERQRFLERSNIRSYEVERDMRLSKAKK